MDLSKIGGALRSNAKEHSPIVLSIAAGAGVLATAYLAASASFKAAEWIRLREENHRPSDDPKERVIERTKLVWKLYIPAGISAVTTIVCIAGANRIEAKKTIAAQTAFAISQRAYSEYRDHVIQEFGERKDQAIRDKIAEERVKDNPPQGLVVAGSGSVLCCELYTGRYFNSDMETLRRAQNDINAKALAHDYATFDDFYYMLGLPYTSTSGRLGWKSSKLMELQFSTVLSGDGRPCLAFEYNYVETL